jgi:tetratricopeptide (TPR) repeat protein
VGLRAVIAALCLLAPALAQSPSPAQKAYDALFREAIEAAPANAGLHKDLGYTYLRVGETAAARDEFAEAIRLDPAAEHIALEYAFLCYETKMQAEARRTFDRLRKAGTTAETRATAERAFENIDRPLAEEIARWSAVAKQSPKDFSAHLELARLAEQRDLLDLAAEHYMAAWKIRPHDRLMLFDAGRILRAMGRADEGGATLLAASLGSSPRVAEQARELLQGRSSSVAEFRRAIGIDPANVELRRSLVDLFLELKQRDDAERELRAILAQAPGDLPAAAQLGMLLLEKNDRDGAMVWFDQVLKSDDDELIARVRAALRLPAQQRRRKARPKPEDSGPHEIGPKEMGERSYKAGYLKDALRYFESAHDADPVDFSVMLKLGWTYNALHQDETAMRWFELAKRSPDSAISSEAGKAYRNLKSGFARWHVSAWAFPFYSTRWHDLFSYGQVKADVRLGRLPFRPYVSVRFIGDTRRTTGEALPQYLSESSFLVALGVATDYRGGVSFTRGKGHLFGGEAPGWFAETHDDGIFVSRFDNDFLVYSQNQTGYTMPVFAGLRTQVLCNVNITMDTRRESWANFVELGPGVKVHWRGLPESLVFSANAMRGVYLIGAGGSGGAAFNDLRVGFWYAFTR